MDFLEELALLEASGTAPQEEVGDQSLPDRQEEAPQFSESEVQKQLSAAEKRLEKAMLYRQWVTGDLYEGDDSEAAREITTEFQQFAQGRLKVLLGLESEKPDIVVESTFTEPEIAVLKSLALVILNKKGLQPVVKQKNEAPTPPPKPTPKPAPKPPQLRKRTLPTELKPAAPAAPPKAPVAKPPAPAPQKPAQPKPAQSSQKVVHYDNETFEANGRVYKVLWKPIAGNEYGPVEQQRIKAMRPETFITLRNGLQVAKDAQGSAHVIINQDTTPKAPEPDAVPFPTKGQMEYITMQQAGQQGARNMDRLDRTIAGDRTVLAQGTDLLGSIQ